MISTDINRAEFDGGNNQSVFVFRQTSPQVDIPVTDASHIKVYVGGVVKTITTHYTVSILNKLATITFTVGNVPGTGTGNVIFIREVPFKQDSDLANNDQLDAESLENQLDLIVNQSQQLNDKSQRSLKVADTLFSGDAEEVDLTLTKTATERAEKSLKFDSSGALTVTSINVDDVETFSNASAASAVLSEASKVAAAASETAANESANAVSTYMDSFDANYLGAMATTASQGNNPTTEGTWTKNSSTITVQSATDIKVGQVVTGTGMTAGSNVLSVVSTTVVVSNNMDAAGTEDLTFTGYGVYGTYDATDVGPTLNNDGTALANGALYYNTTNDHIRIYDSSTTPKWRQITTDLASQGNIDKLAVGVDGTSNTSGSPGTNNTLLINTVATDSTALNTVATDIAKINTLDGLSTEIGRLGSADYADGADAFLKKLGHDDFSNATTGYIKKVADIDSEVAICGADLTYEEDLGSIAVAPTTGTGNNITVVGNNTTNINHVAGQINPTNNISALGPQATNIGHVGGQISPTNNLATVAGQISPTNNVSTLAGLDTALTNLGPKSTELTNLGTTACVADMALLGTTDCVADMALLGTSAMAHASTGHLKVLSDIHANVTTVAGISGNVTTVAGDTTEINTVAGDHTEILNLDALDAEITLLGTNDHAHATTGNLKLVGDNIDDVVIVAGELLYKEDLGGVADAVTTSTGNAISDVADNEVNIDLVAGQISPTNHIGALGPVASNITTVATAPIPANMATVAPIAGNITTVAGISGNVTSVAGISGDVTAVAGDATDIGTVAASIADVNRYANEYKIQATAPGSPSEGDLWYDETNDILKHYNGGTSAWEYNSVSVAASPMHFTEGITEALGTGSASGTTITVDLDTGNFFEADLNSASGNIVTFTINNVNATSGYVSNFIVKVKQHASSAKAITWATVVSNGTNVDWAGGAGPDVTTTANAIDIFSFTTYDNGTTWYGGIVGQEYG